MGEKIEPILKFKVEVPKGLGKNKSKIASLNEYPKWHWATQSKVKKTFKDLLMSWFIPKSEAKLETVKIIFKLYRHNKRVLDSDNLGFIIKWSI